MPKSWSGKIYYDAAKPSEGYSSVIDAGEIHESYEFALETHGTLNVGGMRLERDGTGSYVMSPRILAHAERLQDLVDLDLDIRFQSEPFNHAPPDTRRSAVFPIRFDHSKVYTRAEPPVVAPPVDPPVPPVADQPKMTLPPAPTLSGQLLDWAGDLTAYLRSKGF